MFAHYAAGEMDGGIVLNSLVPGSVSLANGTRLTVTGDYPLKPNVTIRVDAANDKPFPVSFRTPANARLKSAQVNGESIAPTKTDRGFHQITRQWTKGFTVAVEFEYLLGSHIQSGQDGKKWIAFTYGPWALAQEVKDGSTLDEPFKGFDAQSTDPLSMLLPLDEQRVRVKDTEITLAPYYLAGSKTTGSRAYFEL